MPLAASLAATAEISALAGTAPQATCAAYLHKHLEPVTGVEPATSSLQVRRSTN